MWNIPRKLHVLVSTRNNISEIPAEISELTDLTSLHLDENSLTSIDPISPLTSLTTLTLAHNQVDTLLEFSLNFPDCGLQPDIFIGIIIDDRFVPQSDRRNSGELEQFIRSFQVEPHRQLDRITPGGDIFAGGNVPASRIENSAKSPRGPAS